MPTIPSAKKIMMEALRNNLDVDINTLHAKTFELLISYRSKYYERRVNELLLEVDLPVKIRNKVKKKILEPIVVDGKEYSNFMEEVSRRVSQAFQPISGSIAELCAERELIKNGLIKGINFVRRKERADFTVYYPNITECKVKHRIEVKNVSLRERATRGLAFDGDSLFGFFNQLKEFTESNVKILDDLCSKTGGYCYVPPKLLEQIPYRGLRFRLNTQFGKDMSIFVREGQMPT